VPTIRSAEEARRLAEARWRKHRERDAAAARVAETGGDGPTLPRAPVRRPVDASYGATRYPPVAARGGSRPTGLLGASRGMSDSDVFGEGADRVCAKNEAFVSCTLNTLRTDTPTALGGGSGRSAFKALGDAGHCQFGSLPNWHSGVSTRPASRLRWPALADC